MDAFGQKRPRCPNWTEQDKVVLVKNIRSRKDILFARHKGDYATKEAINIAWHEVLQAVNDESHFPRTLEQVKKQYENLKLRAKQLYMDMQQCTSTVKPHIVSPVMQMMIDDLSEFTSFPFFSLSFNELSNQSPARDKGTKPIQPTPPPPPLKSMVGASRDSEEGAGSDGETSTFDKASEDIEPSQRCGLYNGAHSSNDSNDYNLLAAKRRRLDEYLYKEESPVVNIEIERIKAETEKLRAETELIYQRKECEFALFELKRSVMEAKYEYYTKENERKAKEELSSEKAKNTTGNTLDKSDKIDSARSKTTTEQDGCTYDKE